MNGWVLTIAYAVGISSMPDGRHIDRLVQIVLPAISKEECMIAEEEILQALIRGTKRIEGSELTVTCEDKKTLLTIPPNNSGIVTQGQHGNNTIQVQP